MSHSQEKSKQSLGGLEKALTAYAIAASAAVTGIEDSHATVIYSGLQDAEIGLDSNFLLDLDNNGVVDFEIANNLFEEDNPGKKLGKKDQLPDRAVALSLTPQGANRAAINPDISKTLEAAALNQGEQIPGNNKMIPPPKVPPVVPTDPITMLMATSVQDPKIKKKTIIKGQSATDTIIVGEWVGATNKYLGLEFEIAPGEMHSAWARLSVTDDVDLTATLHDWAYEDSTGTAIRAGDDGTGSLPIPEPGTLALLALGSSGLLAFRRRRRRT